MSILYLGKNPFEARHCKFVKEKIVAEKLEKYFLIL